MCSQQNCKATCVCVYQSWPIRMLCYFSFLLWVLLIQREYCFHFLLSVSQKERESTTVYLVAGEVMLLSSSFRIRKASLNVAKAVRKVPPLCLLSKEKGPEIGSSPPSKSEKKTLMKRMKETAIKKGRPYRPWIKALWISAVHSGQIIRRLMGVIRRLSSLLSGENWDEMDTSLFCESDSTIAFHK